MLTFRDATLPDIGLVRARLSRRLMAIFSYQVAQGNCFLLMWHDEPMGLVGLVASRSVDAVEVWLALDYGLRGSKSAAGFTGAIIRKFRSIPFSQPLAVLINADHLPGERMARLCGFVLGEGQGESGPRFWFLASDIPPTIATYADPDTNQPGN